MFMFYLILISANYGISETTEPCKAQPNTGHVSGTVYYACDSSNYLQTNVTIEPPGGGATIINSYICKNGSWAFSTEPTSNELCVALSAQENITTFYSCDSNNNVQERFTFTSNLTYSLIPQKTCVNRVWIITDQQSSNAPTATTLRASVAQGKSHQQESSVTKLKPAVILMTMIFCFTLH